MDKKEHQRSSVNECDLTQLNTELERLRMENQILQLERDNARSKINLIEARQQGLSSQSTVKLGQFEEPSVRRRVDTDIVFNGPYTERNKGENTPECGEKKGLYPELLTPDRKVGTDCSTPVPDTMFSQELAGDIGSPFLEGFDPNFPWEKASGRTKSALTKKPDNKQGDVEIKEEVSRDCSIGTKQSQRPCITPDRFNGQTSWHQYLKHFEACKDINGWTEEQASAFLTVSLQGEALRLLDHQHDCKLTYRGLTKLLEQRFGPSQQAENFLFELRHRRQGQTETLKELGQVICELAIKAYPDIPEVGRKRLEKNHFIEAIEDRTIREGVHRARPKDIDEAIRAAIETENYERIEEERRSERRPHKLVRGSEKESEQLIQKLEHLCERQATQFETMTRLMNERFLSSERVPKPPTPGNSGKKWRRKEDLICFNCNENGHFARECPLPEKERSGNDEQLTGRSTGRL